MTADRSRRALLVWTQLLAGILIGLASFASTVPISAALARPEELAVRGDGQQTAAALRYFVWDDWRWPLLRAQRFGEPPGSVIAFNDGIPAYALTLRLVRWALDPQFRFLLVWLALCFALQGAAAVIAVQLWGAREWPVALAAAGFAVSMPAWIARVGQLHAALCAHALLLLALGLCGAARRRPTAGVAAAAVALTWLALAVHPYLFVMVALLALATFTMLWQAGWPRSRALLSFGVSIAGSALLMWALGMLTPHGKAKGFAIFSMNLLSPIYPPASALLGRRGGELDGTGGQYEGFNYLGLGLLLLVAIAWWVERDRRGELERRYWPLEAAVLGMAALALSNEITVDDRLLVALPAPPAFVTQFRAPGRFFWPLAYLLVLAGLLALARRGRRGAWAVLVLAALQWADVRGLRAEVRAQLARPGTELDTAAWSTLIARHDRVLVSPAFACAYGRERDRIAATAFLASGPRVPISTSPGARPAAIDCAAWTRAFPGVVAADRRALAVLLGRDRASVGLGLERAGWRCADFADGIACSAIPEAAALLPAIGSTVLSR